MNCSVIGCDSKARGHGLCLKHYTRMWRYGDVAGYRVRGNDLERLEASYAVDPQGCWLWTKSTWNGYGKSVFRGRTIQAHRLAWLVLVGEIQDGLQVNHKCHIKSCINPAHLYLGTQVDNMRDMAIANRGVKRFGESHPKAKLRETDVVAIRKSCQTTASLARELGVSESLVRAVRQVKVWKHVHA